MIRALSLFVLIFTAATAPSRAADIAIALTDDEVAVDTSFAGATFTLFGAVSNNALPNAPVDIISVIRGPDTAYRIRRLERRNMVWRPEDQRIISSAPGLYITNATRPISDIAPLPDLHNYHLGADYLNITSIADESKDTADSVDEIYANAFLSELEDAGLYRDVVGGIEFKKGALFAIHIDLPATTPVGNYAVDVFLYQDGVLKGRDAASLTVNKVGIERRIYELAHERPLAYGIVSVLLSLLTGWGAALAFRK